MALVVKNYDDKSSTILNAILAGASSEYIERIPVATQSNLAVVGDAIFNYSNTRNEFYEAIIDKIAGTDIDNAVFNNKLKVLKQASFTYGKDFEELFVELIKAEQYDIETSGEQIYKNYKPEILSTFHTVNRANVYPLSIADEIMTRMFQNENGYGEMMGTLMRALETSDEIDEFLAMKNVLNANITAGRVNVITVAPVTDKDTGDALTIAIKKASNNYEFPKTSYNYANVVQTCPKDRQVLLTDTETRAYLDVLVLSEAFNMQKAEFETREITTDDFGQSSNAVVAMLFDERWLKVKDKYRGMETARDPKGLKQNYFKHVQQLLSASPFYNCTIFVQATPTLTAIDLKPATATVPAGGALQLVVEATGTNNPPSKVEYSVDGASDYTTVLKTGLLIVGSDETTTPLTVTATSTFNDAITDTATITVG